MTTAPSFTRSPVSSPGRPTAETRMSASRVQRAKSSVREWQMVTVPSRWVRRAAMGLPTMLLRPSTTHRFPRMGMSYSSSISITPAGVQGTNAGSPMTIRPTLKGWKQSTSLSGAMALMTVSSLRCPGRGSWTRMPSTRESSLSRRMRPSSSSWEVSAERRYPKLSMPHSAQSRSLPAT